MDSTLTTSQNQVAEIIIEAGRTERQYWKDLWNYRELFFFLAWRDILVRYKQTLIGILWALLRPLFTMVVLTVVFGQWAKMPSEGVPYPILVFAAMLPWQFFANSFSGCEQQFDHKYKLNIKSLLSTSDYSYQFGCCWFCRFPYLRRNSNLLDDLVQFLANMENCCIACADNYYNYSCVRCRSMDFFFKREIS